MSLFAILTTIAISAVAMELIAWAAHRYIMHGIGWKWHKSHHTHHENHFEKNDLYALIWAVGAIGLILAGGQWFEWLYWVGIGMTVYGVAYFFVHEILMHRRIPLRWVPKNAYVRRLVEAHHLHHHAGDPDKGFVSFGFLYAPPVQVLRNKIRDRRVAVGERSGS